MTKKNEMVFLSSSFFSALGDTLLVFAVPSGLGISTGDVRAAVLMWLVPAIAIFASTFFSRRIERRKGDARRDYAFLLLGLGVLEVSIAVLSLFLKSNFETLILICIFVFIYAMAKEGIPRLLYTVSVYRYFVSDDEYSRIAGANSALGVAAGILGTLLAAVLVSSGGWKLALLIDALTFIVYGWVILKYGTDPILRESTESTETAPVEMGRGHRYVLFSVPLLFGLNALVWNYLPLIAARVGTASLEQSLALIALLRLPGILSGFRLPQIQKRISLETIVISVPLLTLAATLVFVLLPSLASLSALIIIQGIVAGLYWPADYSLRASLPSSALIRFNTLAVRRFAIVQFLACLLALAIYSGEQIAIGLLVAGIAAVTIASAFGISKSRLARSLLGLVVIFAFTGCEQQYDGDSTLHVRTFSVSRDMTLSTNLTFAAMTVLNDTSAHYFRINRHLAIEGDVIEKYEQVDGGKAFRFFINPRYRSHRNESISSSDIHFTVQTFLSQLPELAGPYREIRGSESCTRMTCGLQGFKIISEHAFELTLKSRDLRFPEKLSSPWLMILKKDRPLYESVGSCKIPYQTGIAAISQCSDDGISVKIGNKLLLIADKEIPGRKVDRELVAEAPGASPVPTLTSLSLFANPNSKIQGSLRVRLLARARTDARRIAQILNLRYSPTYVSGWLAVPVPKEVKNLDARDAGALSCPKGPIRVLLDTSLPQLEKLQQFLNTAFGCPTEFTITQADQYFKEFAKNDFGIAWFTPDFLDIANSFGPFDCQDGAGCNFDWKDKDLAQLLKKARAEGENGRSDTESASQIEELFFKRGYVAPIAEMNWWIKSSQGYQPIHPAGLFQVRLRDFL